jgi:hypothetical protein
LGYLTTSVGQPAIADAMHVCPSLPVCVFLVFPPFLFIFSPIFVFPLHVQMGALEVAWETLEVFGAFLCDWFVAEKC